MLKLKEILRMCILPAVGVLTVYGLIFRKETTDTWIPDVVRPYLAALVVVATLLAVRWDVRSSKAEKRNK